MKKIGLILGIMFVAIIALITTNPNIQEVVGATVAPFVVNKPTGTSENYNFFLTATTTSATSTNDIGGGAFKVAGAKKVMVFFSRTGPTANAGNSRFTIQGSVNGTDWYDYSKIVLATSTSQTTQANVQIGASTTTVAASLKLEFDAWNLIRCVVVETTDGGHQCSAYAEF